MTFQRARSEEQREGRRRAILDTAAAMLTEMPVADLSLNELSRRVGLAKSNVLRYFESREAGCSNCWTTIWELGSPDWRTSSTRASSRTQRWKCARISLPGYSVNRWRTGW